MHTPHQIDRKHPYYGYSRRNGGGGMCRIWDAITIIGVRGHVIDAVIKLTRQVVVGPIIA
eukprot:4222843-Pyramimonas_sp.AAC.2